MSTPFVSIVIPSYNSANWVCETIKSAITQGPVPTEIIVVDDGSTDGSGELIKNRYPDIRVIKQTNQGCSAARETGFQASRGKYIKFLDSDDLLLPGILQRQFALAEQFLADCVYGNWQRLEQSGSTWVTGKTVTRIITEIHPDAELAFFKGFWAPTAAYLWKKVFLLDRHPGWHPGLPVIQDARFPLDAATADASFVHDSEIGVLYRAHSSGSVSTKSQLAFSQDCVANALELWQRWKNDTQDAHYADRKNAVLDCLETVAFQSYAEQPSFSREVLGRIFDIDPLWTPVQSKKRRILMKLVGFDATQWITNVVRTLRRRLPRTLKLT